MPTLQTLAAEFRRDLLRGEQRAAARLVRAYATATARLNRDLARITQGIETAQDAGRPVGVSWLLQRERLENLKREAEAEVARFARVAAQETAERQAAAVGAASEQARELTVAALGPGPASAVASVEVSFVRLPTGAIEELVGVLGDGSPLRRLFDELPALVSERLETALLSGVAAGLGPREIARQARDAQALGLNRALLIARTEVLRAHREATRRTYQANADVVTGWVWHSALDRRCCLSCIAMHGSFHSNDEPMGSHPACRCAMLPRTRSWAELGFHGIEETRPEVEVGSDWFARQPEETKRELMGRAGYESFRRGEVTLPDFVARKENPEWGAMTYARSLKAVHEGRGGEVLGAAAIPGPPPPAVQPMRPISPPSTPIAGARRFGTDQEAVDWGAKQFPDVAAAFSPEEVKAMDDYSLGHAALLNERLRKGEPITAPALRTTLDGLERAMQSGVARLDESVIVFRGLRSTELAANAEALIGTEIADLAFTSTSLLEDVAMNFLPSQEPGAILIEAALPQGTRGLYMSPVSTYPKEREFLLPRASRFKVREVSREGNVTRLKVDLIGTE